MYDFPAAQAVIDRVRQMETLFDAVRGALAADPDAAVHDPAVRQQFFVLQHYLDHGEWLRDYECDERGELPADLKRGVLSEDGLYNLVCDFTHCLNQKPLHGGLSMNYQNVRITGDDGKEARNAYFDGIGKVVRDRLAAAVKERDRFITPERLAADREGYRRKYVEMLGWPLNDYREGSAVPFSKELIEELPELKIYRLRLETLPGLWFEGLIFEPVSRAARCPLVINHPGGGYLVENLIPHKDFGCEQYRDIAPRIINEGIIMFAPQNLIWNDPDYGIKTPDNRNHFDVQLKALGGSMMALETYNTRCAVDYFLANEPIDPARIGMIGLSYGGFFTLYVSAAEPRVKAAFVSCSFYDRFLDPADRSRPDLYWQNSGYLFGEAEIAALIAPRALYMENGVLDPLYPYEPALAEFARLKPYYEAAGAQDKLLFYQSEEAHEIASGDVGLDFFLRQLNA